MPAKKNAVTTPLHLLQQLSKSLVVHLEQACADAQKDAELLLAQIEKQRGKTQEKLIKARAKLDEAGNAGKSKAQTKARAKLAELDDMLALLQTRQSETLNYLAGLKRDAAQSLSLAQGVTQVEKAAAQALASRGKAAPSAKTASPPKVSTTPAPTKPAATPSPAKTATPRSRSTASSATTSTAKAPKADTISASATATARTTRPASSRAKSTPATTASGTTKPTAARKPAPRRKPAAAKADGGDQTPSSSSN